MLQFVPRTPCAIERAHNGIGGLGSCHPWRPVLGQCLNSGLRDMEPCWGSAGRAAAHGKPQESVQERQYCGRDPCGAGADSDYGGAAETKGYRLTTAPFSCATCREKVEEDG